MNASASPRRPWVSVVLALVCSGLGHAYAGRASAAVGVYILRLLLMEAPRSSVRPEPLIKRVVALSGDTVEIRDGALWVNGEPVPRERVPGQCTYWQKPMGGPWREEACVDFVERVGAHAYHTYCTPYLPCGDAPASKVPPGAVFVVGDHRDHSADSRVYGPVPEKTILGRVSYLIFSTGASGVRWDRIGTVVR